MASGATTHWEKLGNSHADEYAKAGVVLHGLTKQYCLEIRALAKIAYQAARWATLQYVSMAQEQHKDSEMLQPKQKLRRTIRKTPQPKRQVHTQCPVGNKLTNKLNKHRIKAATVSDGTLVLFCSTCGAYKWKRTGKLAAVCPGHMLGAGARQRMNMLNALRFPSSATYMNISPHRVPTAQELLTIRVKAQPQCSTTTPIWSEQWHKLAKPSGWGLSRADILGAYGQTESSLTCLTTAISQNDARRAAAIQVPTLGERPAESPVEVVGDTPV